MQKNVGIDNDRFFLHSGSFEKDSTLRIRVLKLLTCPIRGAIIIVSIRHNILRKADEKQDKKWCRHEN